MIGIGQAQAIRNGAIRIAQVEAQFDQRVEEVLGKSAEIGIIPLPEEEREIHIRGGVELPPPVPAESDQRAGGHLHRRQPRGDHGLAKQRPDHGIGQARQRGKGLPFRGPRPMRPQELRTPLGDEGPQGPEEIVAGERAQQTSLQTFPLPAQQRTIPHGLSPMITTH